MSDRTPLTPTERALIIWLKRAIKETPGLTQDKVAEKLGIVPGTIRTRLKFGSRLGQTLGDICLMIERFPTYAEVKSILEEDP